jgi:hypothetical protein
VNGSDAGPRCSCASRYAIEVFKNESACIMLNVTNCENHFNVILSILSISLIDLSKMTKMDKIIILPALEDQ